MPAVARSIPETVLMFTLTDICLPDEIIHAILVRAEEWDSTDPSWAPLKPGLAACSLVCRHWARIIRPIIFEWLTLRSAGDIEQLIVFLDTPSLLPAVYSLEDCIRGIQVIEDVESAHIPWSHQIFRLRHRLPMVFYAEVKMTIGVRKGDSHCHPDRRSALPFAALPRTLPGSTKPLDVLTLRCVQLPSVQNLANCIEHLGALKIELDEVTFAKDHIPVLSRRRPHTHSRLVAISTFRVFEDWKSIKHWLKLSLVIIAKQGLIQADNTALESAETHFRLLLTHGRSHEQTRELQVGRTSRVNPKGKPSRYCRNAVRSH